MYDHALNQPPLDVQSSRRLTEKPHDVGMVELLHAGSLTEKILHLWAGADGN